MGLLKIMSKLCPNYAQIMSKLALNYSEERLKWSNTIETATIPDWSAASNRQDQRFSRLFGWLKPAVLGDQTEECSPIGAPELANCLVSLLCGTFEGYASARSSSDLPGVNCKNLCTGNERLRLEPLSALCDLCSGLLRSEVSSEVAPTGDHVVTEKFLGHQLRVQLFRFSLGSLSIFPDLETPLPSVVHY